MGVFDPVKRLVTMLVGGAEVSAANPLPTQLSGSTPASAASEPVTISSAAVGLTTIPAGAKRAFITVEDADIRFWIDGSTPTSTAGHAAAAGDTIELDHEDQLTGFSAIRSGSTDATLQVTYF